MSSSLNAEVTTKTRSSAKEAVSSRWATRAEQSTRVNLVKQHQQQQHQQHPIKPRQDVNVKQQQLKQQQLNSQPANVICQTWKQVQNALGLQLLKYLAQKQHLNKPKPASLANKAKKVHPRPNKKALEKNKEQLANTLTNIRVSSALQNQLAEITKGESKNYLKSVLSILPAGFDETSALTSSIQNRKRAFMLMDLGRVIRAHAQFITVTCGFGDLKAGELPPTHKLRRMGQTVNSVGRKRKGVYIQPQFKVMKNPSLELLKLLARLGVDLRCNSSDDVLAASQAVLEERRERAGILDLNADGRNGKDNVVDLEFGEEAMILVDDVSKTRKPDGYFRRLMQMQDATNRGSRVEVAVDGVDEVHRIANTVRKLSTRHNSSQARDGCNFILRLPIVEDIGVGDKVKDGTWERLVLSVHAAAMSEESDLVGVSVDLAPWTKSLLSSSAAVDEDNKRGESEQILVNICTHLRLFRLLLLTVGQYHIRIDMTGLPYPFNRDHSELLTRVLKNVICSDVTTEELKLLQVSNANENPVDVEERVQAMAEMGNDPSRCSVVFTADVSDHLVQRAGALCCRIIGVKDGKAVANENPQDNSGNVSMTKHFYIDDGCYGSLGSTKCGIENTCPNSCSSSSSNDETPTTIDEGNMTKKHFPVPLYGGNFAPQAASRLILHKKPLPIISHSSDSAHQGGAPNNLVQSTVWGPTCDGLDKVCDKVMLPTDLKANRDWLVFSNLGCGGFGGGLGLGTAFNGFDPPDVAYCVLGYFAHLE
jgi:Diaminopimelate decarboxylase